MEWLAAGREADIFLLGQGRVLRRYRDGRAVAQEAVMMRWLHGAGYPVPWVHRWTDVALVLDRIQGPTLAEAMLSGACDPAEGGQLMADLHRRLHALEAVTAPGFHERREGGACLVHLDLHPLNVLLRGGDRDDPIVIDWANATLGPAGLDVAMAALIVGQVSLAPESAGLAPEDVGHLLTDYLAAFLGRVSPEPTPHLGAAVRRRAADRHLTPGEAASAQAAADLVRTLVPGGPGDG